MDAATRTNTNESGDLKVESDAKVPFNQLCHLFEKMVKSKNNAARKNEFLHFITSWKSLVKSPDEKKLNSFYPVLRLMLPQCDNERPSYGVKEKLLAKLYIEVLGLAKNGEDAKKLLEYKNPKTNLTYTGDFAEIAHQHVLSKRCITKGHLTIADINQYLDQIAKYNNEKKKDMVKKTLLDLIKKSSGSEQKWLIRILLKDTKLRMGQKAILLAYHPDAEEVYNITTSLKQVCDRLYDSDVRLSDAEIELFQPFRPMLALNAKLDEVEQLMGFQPFSIEIKYDGERSQLHKENNRYKYFSRSGKEYSTLFGETMFRGTLTPHIHQCFADDVVSCVIDGEMMGYNPDLKIFMQKGGQFDIKHVTEDHDLQPCLVAFDLLYLNGKRLTSSPQSERVRLLHDVIRPVEGRLQVAEMKQAKSNQEVVSYLNEAIDRREEGIVIKQPSCVYAPNKRKGSGWLKVKPEYAAGVVDDLDLVIIGGSFGSGRRGNFLSMFHLGVGVRDQSNPSGPPRRFKTFCRVGSGYTNSQLSQIIDKLKPHLDVFSGKSPPEWLQAAKERPEVCVHPKHSLVVQVKASEIIPSSSYPTRCTLRFPRVVALRSDKSYEDALDEDQLEALRRICDGKLAMRHAQLPDAEPVVKKKRMRVERHPVVSARYQGADVTSLTQTSSSFEGKLFCVISGSSNQDKQCLERRIAEHGGEFVQNPSGSILCVVARDGRNVRVRNAIRSTKYDVVKVDWLLRCLDTGILSAWDPNDMIFTTTSTQQAFNQQYDRFGDRYNKDVTISSLKEVFSGIDQHSLEEILPNQDADGRSASLNTFRQTLFTKYESHGFHHLPSSLLFGCKLHLAHDGDTTPDVLQSLARFYGACLADDLNDVTHVIVTSSCSDEQVEKVFEIRRSRRRKFHIVNRDWLVGCVREGRMMDERGFSVSRLKMRTATTGLTTT